jgi:ATP-grasp in the biosynthetic pathway with Ter operon
MKPVVWFNKNFSPTLHQIRALVPHASVIASHTSSDSIMLLEAERAFLEPKGLVGEAYLNYALNTCQELGVQVFFPGKEAALFSGHCQAFSDAGVQLIAVATPDTLDLLDNKLAFTTSFPRDICAIPDTIAATTWPEFQSAVEMLRTRHKRICFKPARGVYGYGFRVLSRAENLEHFLEGDTVRMTLARAEAMLSPLPSFEPILVMQHLPGIERSVDVVAHKSQLAAAVVRQKVGGLGNVQYLESHPALLEVAQRLTAHYRLSGIFNMQFREDEHGVPHILEINARASGGLRISMASGLNFAWVAVQLALGLIRPTDVQAGRTDVRITEIKEVVELRDYELRSAS